MLRCVLNDIKYDGSIYFTDKNNDIVKKIRYGYVPQKLEFDKSSPFTAADYITASISPKPVFWGFSFNEQSKANEALYKTGISHIVSKRLGELSNGEMQRLLLAIAIIPLPDILILDALDFAADKAAMDDFHKLIYGLAKADHVAVIVVSDAFDTLLEYSDSVILLDNKSIVAQKSPGALFKSDEFLRIYGKRDI